MKIRAIATLIAALVATPTSPSAQTVGDEAAVRHIWDEYMVRGEGGQYQSGEHKGNSIGRSFETAGGSIASATLTARGIAVSDLRGSSFLGFVRGVGWRIFGGLVAQTSFEGGLLELCGRQVVHKRGGFLGFDSYHGVKDETWEALLLLRPRPGERATILHQWVIPTESDVRGSLNYDPATRTATVRFTGILPEFVQSVQIPP